MLWISAPSCRPWIEPLVMNYHGLWFRAGVICWTGEEPRKQNSVPLLHGILTLAFPEPSRSFLRVWGNDSMEQHASVPELSTPPLCDDPHLCAPEDSRTPGPQPLEDSACFLPSLPQRGDSWRAGTSLPVKSPPWECHRVPLGHICFLHISPQSSLCQCSPMHTEVEVLLMRATSFLPVGLRVKPPMTIL